MTFSRTIHGASSVVSRFSVHEWHSLASAWWQVDQLILPCCILMRLPRGLTVRDLLWAAPWNSDTYLGEDVNGWRAYRQRGTVQEDHPSQEGGWLVHFPHGSVSQRCDGRTCSLCRLAAARKHEVATEGWNCWCSIPEERPSEGGVGSNSGLDFQSV